MATTLSTLAFISFFLVLVPLPWHWRARNIATLSTIFWLAIIDLTNGIKAAIWANDVLIRIPVFCDIALFLYNAASIALPAAGLCITVHLENVSSPRYKLPTPQAKTRRRVFEIFMCFILPVLFSLLHMVVQGHRFDIVETLGCVTNTYLSWASIFLFYVPPLIVALISSVFAGFALRWFVRRRAQFHQVLTSSRSGLTTARYFRLMALAICEMIAVVGLCTYCIIVSVKDRELRPWISWENVHSNFGRIVQFPRIYLTDAQYSALLGTWSVIPASSVLFFLFFGFGEEAVSEYRRYGRWVGESIPGLSRCFGRRGDGPSETLPTHFATRTGTSSKAHEMSTISGPVELREDEENDRESKWDGSSTLGGSHTHVPGTLKVDYMYPVMDAPPNGGERISTPPDDGRFVIDLGKLPGRLAPRTG